MAGVDRLQPEMANPREDVKAQVSAVRLDRAWSQLQSGQPVLLYEVAYGLALWSHVVAFGLLAVDSLQLLAGLPLCRPGAVPLPHSSAGVVLSQAYDHIPAVALLRNFYNAMTNAGVAREMEWAVRHA